MGCETKTFNPGGLPLPDDAPDTHPKVTELRALAEWAEGMVWTSLERHGAMTGIMKSQIDWIPLNSAAVRPTQGKILAVMQVSGGSRTLKGAHNFCIIRSYLDTMHKQGHNLFEVLRLTFVGQAPMPA